MPSISLNDVCIDLPIFNSRGRSLKSAILSQAVGGRMADDRDRGVVVIRALSHLTLQLEHGTRVALIGSNGAGKTTLLRVMAKIYPPTQGTVEVSGRVACLTDLNVGMDSEATGYENIRMRGILLGLNRQGINALVDDVAAFAELGDYLTLPIRCYSQGMMLRLAFGISTAIRPDIVILDEIIGVGDQVFAQKARQRLSRFIDTAGIVVIATHDLETISKLCTSAIWLSHGSMVDRGPLVEILARYTAGLTSNETGAPI
jgi:ABC-2 type transport system ATP-binding protein/lipopolysaccharide transport system ATP-binding protein